MDLFDCCRKSRVVCTNSNKSMSEVSSSGLRRDPPDGQGTTSGALALTDAVPPPPVAQGEGMVGEASERGNGGGFGAGCSR